jgi:VWFA-related protein
MPATNRLASALATPLLLLSLSAGAQTPIPQGPPPAAGQPIPQPAEPIQIQLPPRPQEQILTLKANARAVLLDVVVTDGHGHAVHGLTAQDFQIFEDGQPQAVASLEEHHAPTATQLAAMPKPRDLGPNTFSNRKQPTSDSTTTVFLLDSLDSSVQAQMYARSQLLSWVGTMQPGTQVAIFQLDTQLHLVQGFTSDPEVLKTAIKERDKPEMTAIPRGGGYVTAASQWDVLTRAMQSIGAYLQTRPGRKNLVWFTTHIPRYAYDDGTAVGGALHDSQGFLFDYSKATDALVLGEVSVYPIDTRGLQTDPAFSAAHSGHIGNNSTSRFETRQFFQHTDLDQVAEATGGKAFYNTNGIKGAVSEVIETGSSYYTLSYYPTNKKWDGSYRNLKVASERSGVQLEYRHGYYAQVNEGAPPRFNPAAVSAANGRVQLTHSSPSPDEAAFAQAMHLGAIDPGQIIFAAHVDVDPAIQKLPKDQSLPKGNYLEQKYRDKPFRTARVTYLVPGSQIELEPAANSLHHGSLEFTMVLVDDKDMLVNSANEQLEMNLKPETYTQIMTKGFGMPVIIQLPEKGTYFLRVGIHDKSTGKVGTVEINTSDIKIGPLLHEAKP